ncbi:MAG: GNAT family N-acetyltransferase [Acidimicrobiales bacterium]
MADDDIGPIEFADDEVVPIADLVALYEAVGWLIQAADPDALARAVDRSTYVTTARDADGQLIGLARCLSDDVSIMYLQDVLVHPDHQRARIGTVLVGACLHRFEHVRRMVLMTDDEAGQHEFYRSLGFTNLADLAPLNLHTFVKISALPPS